MIRPALNRLRIGLIAIAAGALALRLAPLVHAGGPLAWAVDYDEAVYFAASALLWKGVLPYRDFVFVHPPGIAYFSALVSWMSDPSRGFAAVRILAALTGATSTYLAGRIAGRKFGPAAAVVAAALYATYPDAVNAERGAFLEMALNFACLGFAYVWLRSERERPFVAGLLCGCACAVKIFGGMWFLAALASAPKDRFRRDVPRFVAGGVLAGIALLAPLALRAPKKFIEDVLLFHSWRPPDGVISRAARLPATLAGGHVVATFLAVVALLLIVPNAARGRLTREERFFSIAMLLTIVLFFASSSYWPQYNAHLAASQCVLAGIGAGALLRRVHTPAAIGIALFLAMPSLRVSILRSRNEGPSLAAYGAAVRAQVPKDASLFTFEPQWSLAAGRLPQHGDGAPVLVDSYGAMLLDAVRDGRRFRDTATAFQSPYAQPLLRARLAKSDSAILGWRRDFQMNAETRAWFDERFACDTPGDLCIWTRITSLPVTFGSEWYELEGAPEHPWRWMASRGTIVLTPAASGRLSLTFEVPREAMPCTVTVDVDGRVLDRIAMSTTTASKSYDVTGRLLTLTVNRTIVPARLGINGDTRELGLRLDRLMWTRR